MNLTCRINEKTYKNKMPQGATFSEEYNETLDSGTIQLNHVELMKDLKPYDDVYIWDSAYDFKGYDRELIYFEKDGDKKTYLIEDFFDNANIKEIKRTSIHSYPKANLKMYEHLQEDPWSDVTNADEFISGELAFIQVNCSDDNKTYKFLVRFIKAKENDNTVVYTHNYVFGEELPQRNPVFYKHLLVNNFTEQMINLKDFTQDEVGVGNYTPIYNYTIQLFSETKKLDAIQLPNISITEPIQETSKKTIYDYLDQYLEMYSPKIKVTKDDYKWTFEKKYFLSVNSLYETFNSSSCPDFSLGSPSFRALLSKIMITKDRIPYVKNDVIYALDITRRNGDFNKSLEHVNYVSGSMSSADFCDNLRKTYSNALSQENTSRSVEHIGFRSNSNALMTLSNMELQTRFPIYKINKLYMCYYKKIKINGSSTKYFLCKQDITPLVKLDTERNVLSQDWSKFSALQVDTSTRIEALMEYKMCTIGYNIGSNVISGWGTRYTYPIETTFWNNTRTYIENIAYFMDSKYPYGIYSSSYFKEIDDSIKDTDIISMYGDEFKDNVHSPFTGSLIFKSFMFEVDYQGFYNGTVIHSKDTGRDNITINDNPSESLTLLEQDGLYSKEKVNRFGNKSLTINARYNNINQLQQLGSVYDDYHNDDVIIYHREYQIWDNEVVATYYGTHDYVLKNYFTNVYAKHRTWSLMPYSESVRRSENRKMMILMSKSKIYYETENDQLKMDKFSDNEQEESENIAQIKKIFSFLYKNEQLAVGYDNNKDSFNFAYILYDGQMYATDLNAFVNGNSLCFNVAMSDNISAGNYIEKPYPKEMYSTNSYSISMTEKIGNLNVSVQDFLQFMDTRDVKSDVTGSIQKWYKITDEHGFSKKMGLFLCHVDYEKYIYKDNVLISNNNEIFEKQGDVVKTDGNSAYASMWRLPKIDNGISEYCSNIIGNEYELNKDNKEIIDMTYQIEPITNDNDIMFSQWLMKLSDISNIYRKKEKTKVIAPELASESFKIEIMATNVQAGTSNFHSNNRKLAPQFPMIIARVNKASFNNIRAASAARVNLEFNYIGSTTTGGAFVNFKNLKYKINKVELSINSKNIGSSDITNVSKCSVKLYGKTNCLYEYPTQSGLAINHIERSANNITMKSPKINYSSSSQTPQDYLELFYQQVWLNNSIMPDDEYYYFYSYIDNTYMQDIINYPEFIERYNYGDTNNLLFNCSINRNTNYEYWLSYDYGQNDRDLELSKFYKLDVSDSFVQESNVRIFRQNMFLGYSKSKNGLNKTIVYDEYGFADEYTSSNVYSIGDVVKYKTDGINYDLYKCKKHKYKTETFNTNYWEKLQGTYLYENYLYKIDKKEYFWKNKDIHLKESVKVSEVFDIKQDSNQNYSYINVDLNPFTSEELKEMESISYWYVDKGTLKFVFGVKLSEQDKINKNVKIYLSKLSVRDTRIFDRKTRMVIGNQLDIGADENKYEYAEIAQYYSAPKVPKHSISYNNSNNIPLNLERISSKYQKANTGPISINSDVYFGDEIKLSFGSTEFVLVKVNNKTYENNSIIKIGNENLNVSAIIVPSSVTKSMSITYRNNLVFETEITRVSSNYSDVQNEIINLTQTVYVGDVLKINVKQNQESLEYEKITINGVEYSNNTEYTVSGDVDIVVYGRYKKYTLSISKDQYTNVVVSRTSTSQTGVATGSLANNDDIYYGDELSISVSTNTEIKSFIINEGLIEGTSYNLTVDGDVNVSALSKIWHVIEENSYSVSIDHGDDNVDHEFTSQMFVANSSGSSYYVEVSPGIRTKLTMHVSFLNENQILENSSSYEFEIGKTYAFYNESTKEIFFTDDSNEISTNLALGRQYITCLQIVDSKRLKFKLKESTIMWGTFEGSKVEQLY